ncbi:MAG: hypothetical protein RL662_409 [Bacteroidota bacterium]|jgi:hypothetical protein
MELIESNTIKQIRMKANIKSSILNLWAVLTAMLIITACSPQENDDHSLGAPGTATLEQLSFTVTPSENKNIITLTNTSKLASIHAIMWDLGNGATSKNQSVTVQYPFEGDYTIALTVYTPDGASTTKSQTIHIDKTDYSLLNSPMYNNLTGGITNVNGKTWVFDQTVEGHFGIGPASASSPIWWSSPPEGKAECSLYKQSFTFKLQGSQFIWKNEGKVYTNEAGRVALATLGYSKSTVPPSGDYDVEYTPQSYSFSLNEMDKTLVLSNGAFFGHYTGGNTYSILNITESELYLKVNSVVESGNAWWYRFIPKQ